jgi:pentatricopeptide repeat protein
VRRCSREALALFDAVDCRDVVTWNIVIRGYILGNRFKEERMQFRSMVRDEVLPDDASFATALLGQLWPC